MVRCQWDQYLGWPLTIALWLLIFLSLWPSNSTTDNLNVWYGITAIVAILYLGVELCSPNFRAMLNQQEAADVYEFMERLFRAPPRWEMHVECYHNKTVVDNNTDTHGRTKTHRHTKRVVTFKASEQVRYQHWRDISSPFRLNSEAAMENLEIPFVRLNLSLIFEWAADQSEEDYNHQREMFKAVNRRDVYQDFSETKTLTGWTDYSLIKVSDYEPPYYSHWWYIVCILLTFAELYKMHVNKYIVTQDFIVHKLLSTRNDLNALQLEAKYSDRIPGVIMPGRRVEFRQNLSGQGYSPVPVGEPIGPSTPGEMQEVPPKGP